MRAKLKDNEKCLDGEEKVFGTQFYTILDRKVKTRKRAREISKDKEPQTTRRSFQSGPSRSNQGNRLKSQGSFHNRGGSRSAPRRGQQQKGSKGYQKGYETIPITKMGRRYIAQVADTALSTNLTLPYKVVKTCKMQFIFQWSTTN